MAYQAVRLLTGDLRPEQFMTVAGEERGFFDALSLGRIASSDRSAIDSEPASSSSSAGNIAVEKGAICAIMSSAKG
jgi:conjugal transfer pilus assembly protein TraF